MRKLTIYYVILSLFFGGFAGIGVMFGGSYSAVWEVWNLGPYLIVSMILSLICALIAFLDLRLMGMGRKILLLLAALSFFLDFYKVISDAVPQLAPAGRVTVALPLLVVHGILLSLVFRVGKESFGKL